MVSCLVSFRLWAWYDMSTRSLYFLLSIWIASVIASLAFVVDSMWSHGRDIIHIPIFNVCMTKQPIIWTQWLPGVIEHGFYFSFLFYNAMATPRSAHRPALAILYRDGLLFYLVTFGVMLAALINWKYAARLYMGVTLYTPWIVFQMAISRLLLHVRTSQMFDMFTSRRKSTSGACQAPHPRQASMFPLQSFHSISTIERTNSAPHPRHPLPSVYDGEDDLPSRRNNTRGQSLPTPSQVHGRQVQHITSENVNEALGTTWSSNQRPNFWHRRLWWLFPDLWASEEERRDIYIFVDGELSSDEMDQSGGVHESRLGRFDHWL